MRNRITPTHKPSTPRPIMLGIALSMTLLLSGCAHIDDSSDGARPDWLDGNSPQYPRLKYIIGRGQAKTLATAQDRARANIAKTFQVDIHVHSSDSQEIKQRSNKQQRHVSRSSQIRQQINTQTHQIINGIEIAALWRDPSSQNYYTLAILARQPASTRLRQQMEQLDTATWKAIAASRASNDALSQAGFAAQALAAQRQRQTYQKMATVIDLSGTGITPRWQTARLKADLDRLLKRIHIHPISTGTSVETMLPLLTAALATAGLTPSDKNNSDYILTGQLSITDLGQRDHWHWQRAVINIQLTDKASGQVRGSQTWSRFKAAGLDSDTAQQRLLEQIEKTLKQDMRQTLIDMAIAH